MNTKRHLSALLSAVLISVATVGPVLTTPAFAVDSAVVSVATASTPVAAIAAESAPQPEAASKVVVDNPYGLDALWQGGDFIARGVLILLVLMSMGSWYVTITKLLDQYRMTAQAREVRSKFWSSTSVQAATNNLKAGSAFRYIAEIGIKSTEHHDGALLERIDFNTWITMSIQRSTEKVQTRLQDGLAVLATVGSTAPFVGLFGTVWGIYHALTAIGIAGQASIDKVAGPVGEALIMTAIGLAVAVPAVLGYNWLVRRNKAAMEDIRAFSADLHAVLLSGVMSSSQAGRGANLKKTG
ncbi:MotA/TolQ/ExbB proton channel family protein [Glaciimonas immobilis]|uniref:Biopolymer transport protein ExbB n=1 Tax=Glaciimonas immobilis TaxID=728004 RepID=A0A840RNM7_9BURK|nr:MotA/TolQ/ExbB proton channel family protein [Glaciimonas immobilis]KAF3999151.1 MotA/TolQ/ExbB proton channel family protein [Glaciimonas immobilis]MBB5198596.1 biopolymer transport protein ExbB [Glaciimonas immobilis]